MAEFRDYKKYTSDPSWAKTYSDFQRRYFENPKESDKKIARLLLAALREMRLGGRPPRILDLGCSTGNLLRHLKAYDLVADLNGYDLMAAAIENCRRDRSLDGINFEVVDVLDLPANPQFDVITMNSVTYLFDDEKYSRLAVRLAEALSPRGVFIGYEMVFPGDRQEVHIEKSIGHPEGLRIIQRSEKNTVSAFIEAGFADIEIMPFEIPIDMPKPAPNGTDDDLTTYTVRDDKTNRRLMYRGPMYQPWSHIVARKMPHLRGL